MVGYFLPPGGIPVNEIWNAIQAHLMMVATIVYKSIPSWVLVLTLGMTAISVACPLISSTKNVEYALRSFLTEGWWPTVFLFLHCDVNFYRQGHIGGLSMNWNLVFWHILICFSAPLTGIWGISTQTQETASYERHKLVFHLSKKKVTCIAHFSFYTHQFRKSRSRAGDYLLCSLW